MSRTFPGNNPEHFRDEKFLGNQFSGHVREISGESRQIRKLSGNFEEHLLELSRDSRDSFGHFRDMSRKESGNGRNGGWSHRQGPGNRKKQQGKLNKTGKQKYVKHWKLYYIIS